MPTILTKKSDTPGAVPATANLTNAAGGAELAVNTADKRLFTINSSSAVVELGTNPGSLTCADASFTVARIGSLTISSLSLTNATFASATITNLTSTSATITNLINTSASITTITNSPTFSAGTANGVLYLNGSKVATSGSALVFDGTNLGIGTASPFTTLDVNGYFTAGVRNTTNISLTSGTHYFGSSSSDLLRNNIVGNINADNTTPVRLRFYKSRGTSASPTAVSSGDQTNDIQTYAYDGASYIQATTIQAVVTATPSTNSVSSALLFSTNGGSSSPTERMRIDSSGNVGIGTASPLERLHVAGGPVLVTGVLSSLRANSNSLDFSGGAGRLIATGPDASTYAPIIFGNATTTNFAERMRIDSSGNVGIGTASPGVKLDVVGDIRSTTGNFYAVNGGAFGWGDLSTYVGGNASTDFINFVTAGSERARIDSSGNVGIGTTSPSSYGRLGVMTPTANYGFFGIANSAGGAGGVQMAQYYSTAKISYIDTTLTNGTPGSETAYLAFATANNGSLAERMRIAADGSVGIGGTASAFAKVEVLGTLPSSSSASQGYRMTGEVPSGSTSSHTSFNSAPSVQAASFTLSSLYHFRAIQGAFGAGSTVNSQAGFFVDSSLTGASNNYGFYSNIASGSNRWNFYANGTANNYFAGNVGIGYAPNVGKLLVLCKGNTASDGLAITPNGDINDGLRLYCDASNNPVGVIQNVWDSTTYKDIALNPLGGSVAVGGAIATNATTGFLYVPTCAGTPTGTPTTITGTAPIVVDTTNNKLYFYSGGQWRDAGP